jgi:hypothetical protein
MRRAASRCGIRQDCVRLQHVRPVREPSTYSRATLRAASRPGDPLDREHLPAQRLGRVRPVRRLAEITAVPDQPLRDRAAIVGEPTEEKRGRVRERRLRESAGARPSARGPRSRAGSEVAGGIGERAQRGAVDLEQRLLEAMRLRLVDDAGGIAAGDGATTSRGAKAT